jgi:hypothetical protein
VQHQGHKTGYGGGHQKTHGGPKAGGRQGFHHPGVDAQRGQPLLRQLRGPLPMADRQRTGPHDAQCR